MSSTRESEWFLETVRAELVEACSSKLRDALWLRQELYGSALRQAFMVITGSF